jgi:hypothetical protein
MAQCAACFAAWGDIGSNCAGRHTPAVLVLATELAKASGHKEPTLEHAGWFTDDAESAIAVLGECDSWVVKASQETVRLADGPAPIWEVNGTKFVCAEGPMFLYDPARFEDDEEENP